MKKIIITLIMLLVLVGCGSTAAKDDVTEDNGATAVATDSEYIKEKGKLVVGITEFAPMDYQENGEWIGFDADMAKAFAESLGVEAEFMVIEWDNKVMELDSKSIDCVWNGMTLNDEVKNAMEASNAYAFNAQVVVMKKDAINNYADVDSIKDLQFAVEAGSAGEEVIADLGYNYVSLTAQSDTLLEVKAGTSDAAVIDLLMAGAMVGEGTDYDDLAFAIPLNSEEYGVGFRKGSDLAGLLNDFFKKTYDDGTMLNIAETYDIKDAIKAQ